VARVVVVVVVRVSHVNRSIDRSHASIHSFIHSVIHSVIHSSRAFGVDRSGESSFVCRTRRAR
jgi:hypothetical protein